MRYHLRNLLSPLAVGTNRLKGMLVSPLRLDDNRKLRTVLDMLRNHSKVKEVQNKPVALQYFHALVKADKQVYDQYDTYDTQGDTPAKKLGTENIAEVSSPRSYMSYMSHEIPIHLGIYLKMVWQFVKCYYCAKAGNKFETNIKRDYQHHGATRHHNKPMYPNSALQCWRTGWSLKARNGRYDN